MREGIATDLVVGVLGGVAAIIAASKWVADSFKEWRIGREVKFKEIRTELELEKQKTETARQEVEQLKIELQVYKADLEAMKLKINAILPLLRHLNKNDEQTKHLLDLFENK